MSQEISDEQLVEILKAYEKFKKNNQDVKLTKSCSTQEDEWINNFMNSYEKKNKKETEINESDKLLSQEDDQMMIKALDEFQKQNQKKFDMNVPMDSTELRDFHCSVQNFLQELNKRETKKNISPISISQNTNDQRNQKNKFHDQNIIKKNGENLIKSKSEHFSQATTPDGTNNTLLLEFLKKRDMEETIQAKLEKYHAGNWNLSMDQALQWISIIEKNYNPIESQIALGQKNTRENPCSSDQKNVISPTTSANANFNPYMNDEDRIALQQILSQYLSSQNSQYKKSAVPFENNSNEDNSNISNPNLSFDQLMNLIKSFSSSNSQDSCQPIQSQQNYLNSKTSSFFNASAPLIDDEYKFESGRNFNRLTRSYQSSRLPNGSNDKQIQAYSQPTKKTKEEGVFKKFFQHLKK